jgi:hypothetical protein
MILGRIDLVMKAEESGNHVTVVRIPAKVGLDLKTAKRVRRAYRWLQQEHLHRILFLLEGPIARRIEPENEGVSFSLYVVSSRKECALALQKVLGELLGEALRMVREA